VTIGGGLPLRADDANRPAGASEPILVLDSSGHTARVMTLLFTPNGKQLISVSHDKTVRTWEVATGAPLRVLRPPIGPGAQGMLYAEALSPDGRTLATAGNSGRQGESPILLIDLASGHITRLLTGHTSSVTALAFSPDGSRLASASLDRTARIWNPTEGQCERVLEGHEDQIYGLAFSPDGRRLATASLDKTGRIWSLANGRCEVALRGHRGEVQCVAWRPDGQVVATGGWEGAIRLWTPDGSPYRGFENLGEVITSLKFTADSRGLLYTRNCWGASLLDLATGAERVKFAINKNSVLHGALSPDGTLAATSDGDGDIYLWPTADAASVRHLAGRGRAAWAVAWDRDGEAIAWGNTKNSDSGNDYGPLEHVFRPAVLGLSHVQGVKPNADRGKEDSARPSFHWALTTLASLALEETRPTALAVKRDGSTIATIQLENPREKIYCYSLLPGDRAVVGTILGLFLYDTRSGKLLRQYRGHTGAITSLVPQHGNGVSRSREFAYTSQTLDCEAKEVTNARDSGKGQG
jgi:WD40 repeat protein